MYKFVASFSIYFGGTPDKGMVYSPRICDSYAGQRISSQICKGDGRGKIQLTQADGDPILK